MGKELFAEMFTETMTEEPEMSEAFDKDAYYAMTDKAMAEFAKGLAKLTKKTGISVESTGSVFYDDPKTIKSVVYSDDFSSGDLHCEMKSK